MTRRVKEEEERMKRENKGMITGKRKRENRQRMKK